MAAKALILTPSPGFGALIRQVLEDASTLEPELFSNPKHALDFARQEKPSLLVMDLGFGGLDLAAYIQQLRSYSEGMRLILIPVEENPADPKLAQLGADAVLPSPFYLPDLVAAIESLFGLSAPKDVGKRVSYGSPPPQIKRDHPQEHAAPVWLQDVSLAAQYLTRLSLESASQAALITRGQKVWAYAGGLPQRAAEEVAATLAQHAESDADADLARFIHLEATKADYMLYATSLGGEYTLALVFDAQMPFSQMRAQVNQLANALASAPEEALAKGDHKSRTVNLQQQGWSREEESQGPSPSRSTEPVMPRTNVESRVASRLEPSSPGSYDLHYTYMLIPRLPSHRLEGDLAEKLTQWLPQLCLAFAWRLESLSIQPEFLQWTISMSPDASPESAVRTLEKHLSERIFEEFPRLRRENPSGQFWAPGFLIINGALPNAALVSEYIQQMRARQGVPR